MNGHPRIRRVDSRARNPEAHDAPEGIAAEYAVQALLRAVTECHQPMRLLELGTGHGHSASALLGAMPPGSHLWTIERDARRHHVARTRFSGGGRVTTWFGNYHDAPLEQWGPFDLVFIDADWTKRADEVRLVQPHLSAGAIVILHDVGDASPGRAALPAIRGMGFDLLELWTPRGVALAQIPT